MPGRLALYVMPVGPVFTAAQMVQCRCDCSMHTSCMGQHCAVGSAAQNQMRSGIPNAETPYILCWALLLEYSLTLQSNAEVSNNHVLCVGKLASCAAYSWELSLSCCFARLLFIAAQMHAQVPMTLQ